MSRTGSVFPGTANGNPLVICNDHPPTQIGPLLLSPKGVAANQWTAEALCAAGSEIEHTSHKNRLTVQPGCSFPATIWPLEHGISSLRCLDVPHVLDPTSRPANFAV